MGCFLTTGSTGKFIDRFLSGYSGRCGDCVVGNNPNANGSSFVGGITTITRGGKCGIALYPYSSSPGDLSTMVVRSGGVVLLSNATPRAISPMCPNIYRRVLGFNRF